jgi:hypothetical protein
MSEVVLEGGIMKSRILVSLAVASLSLIFASGCSSPDAKKKSLSATEAPETEIRKIPGTQYTTILFREGKSSLDSVNKELLKDLMAKAHKDKRKIEEIRILAWSDSEYPNEPEKAPKKEISLASDRAQKIRDYLEEHLHEMNDIDAYNMAKRPNLISTLFRNDEFDVKKAFEQSGATSSKLPDGSLSYTKASKALVIIDYEGNEDNLK